MGNFIDKDKGWKKFCTTFKANAGETAGFVGYLRSSGVYVPKSEISEDHKKSLEKGRGLGGEGGGITIAQLASVHEFGSSDGTIPERSYMRSALDENSKNIKRMIKAVSLQVLTGSVTKKKALGVICQKFLDLFAAKIDSNVPPALKDATVERKGSTKTLIDTGQLKNSLDWEVKDDK